MSDDGPWTPERKAAMCVRIWLTRLRLRASPRPPAPDEERRYQGWLAAYRAGETRTPAELVALALGGWTDLLPAGTYLRPSTPAGWEPPLEMAPPPAQKGAAIGGPPR